MFLKEVVINGFKSFADRTRVHLKPGVTCIVGPNGCGKSNIVDAIRWVLGEQSAKALRGGKMQDVIFQGTDKRKPLSLCEVSLIFSDCEKELGTAFNEVSITRRVTRDGGSDYFLNGKHCRLKDIQQLFMDTGIGQVSYSFMVQGQIDQILSSNPAERRTIFEEAAGITKYKTQRREALNKLALVDQNLSRVTDVTEEIGRQITTLKRQASKALRYKRVKHRLMHLDLASNAYQYRERHKTIQSLSVEAARLKASVGSASSILEEKEASLESLRAERNARHEDLRSVQQAVYDLRGEKEQAENQAELCDMRLQDIAGRTESIGQELTSLKEDRASIASKLQEGVQTREQHVSLVGASDVIFKEKSEELEAAQLNLQQAERSLSEKRQALNTIEASMETLRSKATACEVDLKTCEAQTQDLEGQSSEIEQERAQAAEALATAEKEIESLEAKKTTAASLVEQARSRVQESRETFKAHQQTIQDAERAIARDTAQLQALEGLQEKLEGFSEGAKAILKGKLGEVLPREAAMLLSKHFTVDPKHAPALEAILGTAVEAIALDAASKAVPTMAFLREKKLGRACVQVPLSRAFSVPSSLPSFLTPALDAVKVDSDEASARVRDLFTGCYFAESLEVFLDFWAKQPSFEFFLVATQEGALVDCRGLVYGGGQGHKKGSGLIQREAEIRDLKASLKEQNKASSALHEKAKELQALCDEAESSLETAQGVLQEANHAFSVAQSHVRSAQELSQKIAHRFDRYEAQSKALKDKHASAQKRLEDAQRLLEESRGRAESHKSAMAELESSLQHLRDICEQKREALVDVRVELTEKRQRLESLSSGVTQLESQDRELARRFVQCEQELASLAEQKASLETESKGYRAQSQAQSEELDKKTAELKSVQERASAAEAAINELEEGFSGERKALHEQEVALNGLEVKLAEHRSQARFLEEKVQSEYETDVTDVDWKWELWTADEPFEIKVNLDDILEDQDEPLTEKRGDPTEEDFARLESTDWKPIEEEIRTLRSKLSSMGAVNLVAIEEYAELRERHSFLTAQCQDLTTSKDELLAAIDDINHKSQALFLETFEKVRENFKFTFDALFGGGVADLELVNKEDVLESGIDIVARPPGTRLRNLSLLSGGQKTMTAVALLFAIYKVKPSPFCVLDELDAPLDDANIGRFTDMLKTFTQYSQFLVISHNKRTIAAADILYGVTMQERGVTELVSLLFNHKTGKAETVAAAQPEAVREDPADEALPELVEV
ncbi:MAG TPA: chromosome segregation protein SMC [Opitutae bacterium]|nr:chromosome segregation protein SMC [Opitutae bacterium]